MEPVTHRNDAKLSKNDLGDDVNEDKDASATREHHVRALGVIAQAKAFAHRSLYLVDLIF